MLLKAHLTLYSRMSGSRWVITPLWLSGSWRSSLCGSSVYSYQLLISFPSVRSTPCLYFIEPIFAWNVPLASLIFLKSSLVFSFYCFPVYLCTDRWGRLSYLSLVFFGTLYSDGYIFPFLLCFSDSDDCPQWTTSSVICTLVQSLPRELLAGMKQ